MRRHRFPPLAAPLGAQKFLSTLKVARLLFFIKNKTKLRRPLHRVKQLLAGIASGFKPVLSGHRSQAPGSRRPMDTTELGARITLQVVLTGEGKFRIGWQRWGHFWLSPRGWRPGMLLTTLQ